MRTPRARLTTALGLSVAVFASTLVGAVPMDTATAIAPLITSDEVTAQSSTATTPLVIILDLSGSMRDDDGTGTNKLIAAKASIERVLRQQGEGAVVGIWGYPFGGACDAGRYVLPPQPLESLPRSIAIVDSLFAEGNTPTGKAISAAVDELTSRGYHGARIILVSDGESNCASPPCPVAQDLAGSSFELTVDAVGFQQSAAGRAELECVANATAGRYFDAEDGDELIERLDELSSPRIELDVRYSPHAASGTSTLISVTVTNTSSLDAKDVRLNLAFSAPSPDSLLPAVLPPTYGVGNLGPGQSSTREWRVSTGAPGGAARLHFGITAWGSDVDAARVTGDVEVSGGELSASALGPLFESVTDGGFPLVIMGDSYSSGEGTEDYIDSDDECHRSQSTYLAPLFRDSEGSVQIIACSGAVSGNVYTAQHPLTQSAGSSPQLNQLAKVPAPGAVVLTFGGNDIGFEQIIRKCAHPLANTCVADLEFVSDVSFAVAGLHAPLSSVYGQLWVEANSPEKVEARNGAYAPIIVLPYPQITHDYVRGKCANFDPFEVRFTNVLAVSLNAEIKRAVAEANEKGFEVHFATPVQAAFLPDHTYCASGDDAYVHGIVGPIINAQPESFHPKKSGYAAMTSSLIDWAAATPRIPFDPELSRLGDRGWVSRVVDPALSSMGNGTADFETGNASRVAGGSVLTVSAAGFGPHEAVIFVMASAPTTLGTLQADEHGNVVGELWVPKSVELGDHVLHAYGFDSQGTYAPQSVAVRVTSPIPWQVPLAVGLSGMLFAGALTLALVAGLSHRRTKRSPQLDDGN